METALEKLSFLENHFDHIKTSDPRELMKANESKELIKMCKLATRASMERKESGHAFYSRVDYTDLDPELDKALVMWQENGEHHFAWEV